MICLSGAKWTYKSTSSRSEGDFRKMVVSLRDFVKAVLLSACSDWEGADRVRILQNVKNQGKETKTQIILFTNEMSR